MTQGKNGNGKSRKELRPESNGRRPVLVCGGAGFLGVHLCERLLAANERVICVDNFCTSESSAIEHLRRHPDFRLVRSSVAHLDTKTLGPVSTIYNLACAASPIHYQRDPLDTLLTSVRGMDALLSLARSLDAPIFQASTSEIYGHPTIHPQTEAYWGHVNTMGPRACYDEGKRCAETLCFIYREHFGVQARVARIFNTYGPGMRMTDGRVVVNFIVQALAGEPITVYGDGRQTRSFCYVDDTLDGIGRLMSADVTCAGPVNLGNPDEVSVLDLARRIVRLTGSRSKIALKPLPIDDPPRRRPDISLARRELGWQPRTDLDTGLMLTIRDIERRLARHDSASTERARPAASIPYAQADTL